MSYWKKIEKKYDGNMAAFARDIGVSRAVVNQWRRDGRIPAKRAMQVEKLMGGVVSAMEVLKTACTSGKS